jgi:hypothetical protein
VVFPIVSRHQRIVPEFSAKCFFTSLIVRERKEEEENNKKQFKQEKHKAQIVPAGMRTNPFLRSSSLVFFIYFFFLSLSCLRADPSGKRVHFSRAPPQSTEDEEEPENPQRKRKKKPRRNYQESFYFIFLVGTGRERGMNMNAANIS